MGVCLKRVTCLSLDIENEKYYNKKCFVGDTVTLFLTNDSNIQGSIKKLGNREIKIIAKDNKCYSFNYSSIRSFNLDFRCQDSRYKFGS